MTIAMNAKVHRYDATLALIKVISSRFEPIIVRSSRSTVQPVPCKSGGPRYKVQDLTQYNISVFHE